MSFYLPSTRRVAVAAAACGTLLAIGAPLAAADPTTDALGFVNSTARCAAPNTAVAFGATAESRVAICKSPAGQFGYHGVRVSDGAKLIAAATADADGSYVAKQDGVTYTVNSNALVVSDASGVIRREPMTSYHGPKTTQAPAGTTPNPAAKPQAPAASPSATAPSPTAPLPPPLPAEVGGGKR
ncbi:hypothetical protein PT015_24440 [Candidatus Mycobacterium wuenschmannii]|uniref:Protein kinase n=1 Tax=Candidatus Mycobacterium wuenschmannii TaxID=3027808 RepID=A0ABY8VWG8_9MYCO|nr:hypothetical protein [Candidatus Mycobacterium wuenschmannii]WIM87928.1 hypothetical protein PT015_24440 [Candidatus Mycobacterium wuenschmannii]